MRNLLPASLLPLLAASCAGPATDRSPVSEPAPTPTPTVETSAGSPYAEEWNCSSRVELSSLWAEVSKRHDRDGDGRVTPDEYDRGEARFRNYDRNEDGVLDAADFPEDTFFNGFSAGLVQAADGDRDGKVTRAEWDAFATSFDQDGDGGPEKAAVQELMGAWADDWPLFLLSFDQDADGDFDAVDLELTFLDQDFNGDGELVGKEMMGWQPTGEFARRPAPAPGERAPDFTLGWAEGDGEFQLHDPERARPVALIFGSYT